MTTIRRKPTIRAHSLSSLARLRAKLRARELDALDRHKRAKRRRELVDRMLLDRFTTEETTSIKTGDYNFVQTFTPHAEVTNWEEFEAWAKDEAPELLKTELRGGPATDLARRLLEDGQPLPPGMGWAVVEKISQRAA